MSTFEWRIPRVVSMRFTLVCATLSALMLSACGDKKDKDVSVTVGTAAAVKDAPLGEDDVRIVSTDGVLVMSLIGDTVRMQLSDSLRNSVAAEITKDADKSGALAGMITKSVGAAVGSAMGFVVRSPAKDVHDLRYENGHIRFKMKDGTINVKSDGDSRRDNATFSEADAKRFIDAVKKKASAQEAM